MIKYKKLLFCDNTLWGLVNFRGDVINHFIETGHEVVLVAPEKEDKQMQIAIPDRVKYIPVKLGRTSRNPLNDIAYYRQLKRIYKAERPDYIFHYTIKPNIYGTMAAHSLGIPCTVMFTGLGYVFLNKGLSSKIAINLYRHSLKYAEHILMLNESNKEVVLSHNICDERKITVMKGGEGVNINHFEPTDNSSETVTFLFVGRLLWDKGYGEFSDAARIIKKEYPDAKFQLIGAMDPSYPKSIPEEKLQQDINDGIVEYLGFAKDMRSVYERKGIVITLPSYTEGMNRALMEACACGKPIVASNIGGCREMVEEGKNGFLAEARNTESLVNAMRSYLNLTSDQRTEMGHHSRKMAENIFDMKFVIETYKQILHE